MRITRRAFSPKDMNMDINESYIYCKCIVYFSRYLENNALNQRDCLVFASWLIGPEITNFGNLLLEHIPENHRETYEEDLTEALSDSDDYGNILAKMINKYRLYQHVDLHSEIKLLLSMRYEQLKSSELCDIEKNAAAIQRMFSLSDQEIEFLLFHLITDCNEEAEHFFERWLNAKEFSGIKYLCQILEISRKTYNHLIAGKLNKIGMLDIDRREVSVHSDFIMLLQNPSADTTFKEFFSKTKKAEIPLEYHQVKEKKVFQIIRLLEKKPQKSNHILLYGAPGTGKTSFARALPDKLRSAAYEIQRESTNRAEKRRAAIEACLNMTNSEEGSIIIVDEADNLLNTRYSWLLRGETQDKGWLNDLMERPGVRMIWIVNDIENIEPSVLRRFTFSLQFKSFNTSQRIQLWDRIVRKHGIKRFFKSDDISNYAKKYCVSAGVIDQAVATIAESAEKKRSDVLNSMDILLNSYVELINGENHDIQKKSIADAYVPEALNISLELLELERQLKRFDKHLKTSDDKSRKQFNLLFYGPPGTGKSELARYFANQIGRKLMIRRLSDILNPYVGMTERNIRKAFEAAENEDALLVVDEVDSLLFPRANAMHSWQSSMTNEFLTAMESYKGILICTTNMVYDIDSASIRRFNHKIKFDFMTSKGNTALYKKMLLPLASDKLGKDKESQIEHFNVLTPGDFKVVREKFLFYDSNEVTHKMLIGALKEEANLKQNYMGKKKIGF